MDVIELDKRLMKNLNELEKTINQYEKLLKEAETLKVTYKNQIDNSNKSFLEFTDQIKSEYQYIKLRTDSYINEIVKYKESIKKDCQIIEENKEKLIDELTKIYVDYEMRWEQLNQEVKKELTEAYLKINEINKDIDILKKSLEKQLAYSTDLSKKLSNLTEENSSKFQAVNQLIKIMINELENNYNKGFQSITEYINNKFEFLNNIITENSKNYKMQEKLIAENKKEFTEEYEKINKKTKILSIGLIISIIISLIALFGR
ncbi:MAG: hypothetical protein GX270_10350 [Clostridiaceae bacterium]|jgi:hypothetical protein|nr:hypothetical protein [Clostridiaceae bacterium]